MALHPPAALLSGELEAVAAEPQGRRLTFSGGRFKGLAMGGAIRRCLS